MKYYAKSLHDIAEHFDSMAKVASQKLTALGAKASGKAGHILRAEISVWQAAAETLRNTEISSPTPEPAKR